MKWATILAAAIISALLLGGSTQAHVLKTDGSIGAILHIKPDDNPKAGVPLDYALNFQDTKQQFTVPTCDCTLTVTSNNKLIFTQQLQADGNSVGGNRLTFPKNGIYSLNVNGQPKTGNNFQKFSLTYTIRVGSEQGEGKKKSQSIPPLLWIGIASMCGLILLGASRLQE